MLAHMQMTRHQISRAFIALLYACAGVQFIRFYVRSTTFYLRLPDYLAGHERVPFQERVLPIPVLKELMSMQWLMHQFGHPNGVISVERAPFYIVSLIAFAAAAWCTQLLYLAVTVRQTMGFLVFPLFLFSVMFTYTIHLEANYSYPYDMISLACFAAGLLFIYRRQYLPLVALMLIATWNRETTLFLVGVFLLDGASRSGDAAPWRANLAGATHSPGATHITDAAHTGEPDAPLRARFDLRRAPWLRAALLFAIWFVIKLWLAHHYRANDTSENYVRIAENTGRLRLRLLPALLNICGYLFPIVLLFWRRIQPARFGNYVWIAPLWFLVMFYTGVILETRIYGELCSYTAVALVLLAERQASESAFAPTMQPLNP